MNKLLAIFSLLALAAVSACTSTPVFAQTPSMLAATTPQPIKITTGNTFQVALSSVTTSNQRRSLTIQNNNASDSCYLLIGGPWTNGDTLSTSRTINSVSLTGQQGAIVLPAGQAYTRYFPYVPADQILATCATAGDSLYVDFQ